MVSVCTVPARGGWSCEGFGGYKTINRIPLSRDYQDVEILILSQPANYKIHIQPKCTKLFTIYTKLPV